MIESLNQRSNTAVQLECTRVMMIMMVMMIFITEWLIIHHAPVTFDWNSVCAFWVISHNGLIRGHHPYLYFTKEETRALWCYTPVRGHRVRESDWHPLSVAAPHWCTNKWALDGGPSSHSKGFPQESGVGSMVSSGLLQHRVLGWLLESPSQDAAQKS